jgi:hypothetical protein
VTRAERIRCCVFVVALVLATPACSAASKETAVQSGMTGGMVACEALLLDKSIPREPAAEEWCRVVVHGCREAGP